MFPVDIPISQYLDLNGDPLNGGKIYVGQPGQNPETSPMTIYWDFAGTQPVAQPVRTTNGYSVRSGIISPVFVTGDFSITIRDSSDRLIYSAPRASEAGSIQAIFSTLTTASLIGFVQSGLGAVQRTAQDKMRDRLDLRDFGVKAGDGNAYTSESQKAFNEANSLSIACYGPSGNIIIDDTVIPMCSIIGDGPFENGTGMTFEWQGSANKVMQFTDYVSGWDFINFRIDMSNVTTDTIAMAFDAGLNVARFVNIEAKGRHSGPSFGGTYFNHDGIVVVGGNGTGTPYNMSNNMFDHVFLLRCRDGIVVTDPDSAGSGTNNTFRTLFSWCSRNTVRMAGPNNTFTGCETNTEAGQHTYVLSGQFAYAWNFNNCDYGTAASTSGNEPIYADTPGAVNIACIQGGTLEQSADGGTLGELVYDAGTGGKTYRYFEHGVNNHDSTTTRTNKISVGQSISFVEQGGTLTGGWVAEAYSGSNFTGSDSMTVTVDSGDQITYQYFMNGKFMTVLFSIDNFTVGGTPDSEVQIKIPGGKVSARAVSAIINTKDNGTWAFGFAFVDVGGTKILCFRDATGGTNWSASTNASSVQGQITFEIQ